MRAFARAALPALLIALALAPASDADTIYSYTGHAFGESYEPHPLLVPRPWSPDGFFTGSFTVAAPLIGLNGLTDVTPLVSEIHFSDGAQSFTRASSQVLSVQVATDGTGAITAWDIVLWFQHPDESTGGQWLSTFGEPSSMRTTTTSDTSTIGTDGVGSGFPGTWTVTVPEPSTLLLVAAGLLVVGGRLSKRRHAIGPLAR